MYTIHFKILFKSLARLVSSGNVDDSVTVRTEVEYFCMNFCYISLEINAKLKVTDMFFVLII